jgi:hypothetical protein
MGMKYIAVCDRCGVEQPTDYYRSPEGWHDVELKWGQYDTKKYKLCDTCSEQVGFVPKDRVPQNENPSLADKLLEVVAEIVAEQIGG